MRDLHRRAAAPALLLALAVGLGWGIFVTVQRERASRPVIQALMAHNTVALQQALAVGGDANATDVLGDAQPRGVRGWIRRLLWLHQPAGWVTALTFAADTRQRGAVQLLLTHGANPNTPNSDGLTPLMEVCQQPSVQSYTPSSSDTVQNKRQEQARAGIVSLLCEHGADMDASSPEGMDPLFIAAQSHHPLIAAALLDHRADVNAVGTDGQSALSVAVQSGPSFEEAEDVETVKVLLDHGADANEKMPNGGSLFQQACEWIDEPVVLLLLQHGADPNVRSPANGMTTLMQAARQGQFEVAKVALDKGADPNILDPDDGTALFLALNGHHPDIVKLLLDRGANPNQADPYGYTPLMAAALGHDTKSVSLLLAHGADVNQKDPHDETALLNDAVSEMEADYGKRHHFYDPRDIGHWRMTWPAGRPVPTATAALLLAHGADVNASDQWGNTALSLARASGKTALVKLLLAHGAKQ